MNEEQKAKSYSEMEISQNLVLPLKLNFVRGRV